MTNKYYTNHVDGYFDDCPVCQAMQQMGLKMDYHEDIGEDSDQVFDPGFSVVELTRDQMIELSTVMNKMNKCSL